METGATSARGIGDAKARDRAGEQGCYKESSHVSSIFWGRFAARRDDIGSVIPHNRIFGSGI
jgi:hypothetical protein